VPTRWAWFSFRQVRATSTCGRRLRWRNAVPPFVTIVGLFVNADPALVRATLAALPIHLLQFHGDEDEGYCRQFDRPYIKAARVRPGLDLVQYAARFPSAQAILLDAFVEGYGGGGKFSTGRWCPNRWASH
jgi:phosphoribosylanthranilate isomerase